MSRHIIFFINPVSGTKNKKKLEEKILQYCAGAGIAFQILFTSPEGNYTFLPSKICEESISDVVICGGDGTLGPIISALLHTKVNIGIIPFGSGNGLARTAGIPLRFNGAMGVIINGSASPVDVLMVNNRLSCHLTGLGFDAAIAHEFARRKSRGLKAYVSEVIKNFFTIKNYAFMIDLNGKKLTEEAFCVCIANSNQFGNNFKIAPRASICDGMLDVVIFRKSTKLTALISVARQVFNGKIKSIRAKDLRREKVLYFQTKELLIINNQLAPLHIDGDPAETEKFFQIKVLPAAYKLLQPDRPEKNGRKK